jgi:hypothetical protein
VGSAPQAVSTARQRINTSQGKDLWCIGRSHEFFLIVAQTGWRPPLFETGFFLEAPSSYPSTGEGVVLKLSPGQIETELFIPQRGKQSRQGV